MPGPVNNSIQQFFENCGRILRLRQGNLLLKRVTVGNYIFLVSLSQFISYCPATFSYGQVSARSHINLCIRGIHNC